MLYKFVYLASFVALMQCLGASEALAKKPLIAYYDISQTASSGYTYTYGAVPWSQVTHVYVAFTGINGASCQFMHGTDGGTSPYPFSSTEVAEVGSLISALKADRDAHNPSVKIILSVGGAGNTYGFSDAVINDTNAWNLAYTCSQMVFNYGLDGIDYDWEFPTDWYYGTCPLSSCENAADMSNFVNLLSHTRHYLPSSSGYTVSIAVGDQLDSTHYEPYATYAAQLDQYLDFWNVMIYEIGGSWSENSSGQKITELNSPYSGVVRSINVWSGPSYSGITRSKLLLGLPYYSKFWGNMGTQSSPYDPGYQGVLPYGAFSNDRGVGFNIVQPRCTGQVSGWNCYIVNVPAQPGYAVSQGDYCFCNTNDPNAPYWYTYDGPTELTNKTQYALSSGWGGAFFWKVPNGDTSSFMLSAAVRSVLDASSPDLDVILDDWETSTDLDWP